MTARQSLALAALFLATAGGGIATPALAQLKPYTPTGSRVARPPETLDTNATRRMQKVFAQCIHRRESALAERLLRYSDPTAIDYSGFGGTESDLLEEFHMADCLGEAVRGDELYLAMHTSAQTLRTSLAEEAYLAAGQPVTIGEDSQEILADRYFVTASDPNAKAIAAFSDCVVFHAPEAADNLLRTSPASSDETTAVQALVPALSACVVQGREMELTVPAIRGLVADGLWSRSFLGQQAPTEATE